MARTSRPYPNGIIVEGVDITPTFGSEAGATMTYLADTFVQVEDRAESHAAGGRSKRQPRSAA
jgi:hypothetical protein